MKKHRYTTLFQVIFITNGTLIYDILVIVRVPRRYLDNLKYVVARGKYTNFNQIPVRKHSQACQFGSQPYGGK